MTVTLTFNKPFKAFRIQLPHDFGEANLGNPLIDGQEAGHCSRDRSTTAGHDGLHSQR